jgi:hypothetical protein
MGFHKVTEYSALDLIDPVENIKGSPVYIVSGSLDTSVPRILQKEGQLPFYQKYEANVEIEYLDIGHE